LIGNAPGAQKALSSEISASGKGIANMLRSTWQTWGFVGLSALTLVAGGCATKQEDKPVATTANESSEAPAATEPAATEPAATTESAPATEPAETAASGAPAPTESAVPMPTATPTESKPVAEPQAVVADPKPSEAAAVPEIKEEDKVVLLGSPDLTAGIPGEGLVTIEELKAWLDDPRNHVPLEPVLPLGLREGASQIKGLDANPLTRAKIELGRQLYFDPRLSAEGAGVSCASCHHPDEGFGKHTQFGVGINKLEGGRNSPVSYNRILSDKQFWDGRAETLEAQAVGPIANPIEMGNTHDACIQCLQGIEGYRLQFEKIFGKFGIDQVAQAIAAFERSIVTGPSPYDYQKQLDAFANVDLEALKEDDPDAYKSYEEALAGAQAHPMSESAKRGQALYFSDKTNCSACHVGPNLTDEQYYNIGVGMDKENPDLGRYEITKVEKDKGAFKTPTIRNVSTSAPYMHDGSQKTLAEVVEWYAKGGHPNPWLSDRIKKLNLTDQDKADLVAFMEACSGDFPPVNRERLPQ
jgi:cytochrome c peroxidase